LSTYEMIEQGVRVVGALLIVLFLIYASLRFGKKYTKIIGKKSYMQVLDTIPLYNKSAISIVKIGKKYMVIGVSENSTQLIAQLSDDEIEEMKKENALQQKQTDILKGFINLKKLKSKAE